MYTYFERKRGRGRQGEAGRDRERQEKTGRNKVKTERDRERRANTGRNGERQVKREREREIRTFEPGSSVPRARVNLAPMSRRRRLHSHGRDLRFRSLLFSTLLVIFATRHSVAPVDGNSGERISISYLPLHQDYVGQMRTRMYTGP